MDPFIEFRVNLVTVLFVVGVFFSDSSRGAVIVGILAAACTLDAFMGVAAALAPLLESFACMACTAAAFAFTSSFIPF